MKDEMGWNGMREGSRNEIERESVVVKGDDGSGGFLDRMNWSRESKRWRVFGVVWSEERRIVVEMVRIDMERV